MSENRGLASCSPMWEEVLDNMLQEIQEDINVKKPWSDPIWWEVRMPVYLDVWRQVGNLVVHSPFSSSTKGGGR